MKTARSLFASVLFLVLILSPAGISAAGDEIKIGVSAPLTGMLATIGQSQVNGIRLAIDEINNSGGVNVGGTKMKVKLIVEDDENKTDSAATVFKKLCQMDRVLAIIGSAGSTCTLAGGPVAEAAGVPTISPWATNPRVTEGRRYVFRACYLDPFQSGVAAIYAYDKLAARTAACIFGVADDANVSMAEAFRDKFKQKGGKIVGYEGFREEDKDFAPILAKIKAANPDVVYSSGAYMNTALIVRQAKDLGIRALFMGGDGWDSPKLIEIAGAAALEGCVFTNHYCVDIVSPEAEQFVSSYQARFKTLPDACAALSYDCAGLIVQAIERAGKVDREATRDALASTTGFKGVTGEITYEGNGDPAKSVVIQGIKNGKFVYLTQVKP